MEDDVPDAEKRRRFHLIESLQKEISERKMAHWLGETVPVLVEDKHKGNWRGRSPQGKLVFFDDPRELKGQIVRIKITHTGPWSMSGETADSSNKPSADFVTMNSIPLTIVGN